MSLAISAQEIRVAVASNFYHALTTFAQQFEQETGINVKLSSGSSGLLYAQIVRGAPFDLFFSADQQRPTLLEKKELTSARKTYVYGRLALFSPADNRSSQDLTKTAPATVTQSFLKDYQLPLVIANPRLAPYGKAAQQTLEFLEVNQHASHQYILANNVNQAYQFIHSGNAKAGFVAYSLLKAQSVMPSEYWLVPSQFHQPIAQQMVLLTKAKNNKAAKQFFEFILSPSVQNSLEGMGYNKARLSGENHG